MYIGSNSILYIYTHIIAYFHHIDYQEISVMPGTFPETTRDAFTRLGITGVEIR